MNLSEHPATYLELGVTIPPSLVDATEIVLLEKGALGTALVSVKEPGLPGGDSFEIERAGADGFSRIQALSALVEVIGYFAETSTVNPNEILSGILAICGDGIENSDTIKVDLRSQPWRDWVRESREAFKPFRVKPGLWIAPPWDIPANLPGEKIILNPGAAFGLGSHPTTRGCLCLIPPAATGKALDVGTGTTVLAIRAAQCGYQTVVAFDNDPAAVESARENVVLNRMENRVHLFVGELPAADGTKQYSLILANIFLNPLLSLADEFAERLVENGQLILSGIREEDAPELMSVMREKGFIFQAACHDSGWAALRLQKAVFHG